MSVPCPACGSGNREGARFCTGCGSRLAGACPGCGAPAEPGDRFCAGCGSPLGPDQPSSPVLSGERKQVTVLFADVKGSMDLAGELDPEDWASVMRRLFSVLSEGVQRLGGTVDKFTGDGIMAIFGAPISQEDHARRACHAALELRGAIAAYAEKLRGDQGVDLHVRLGLNSGEVVVGGIGDEGRMSYTALGQTVGLAQRMEAMADADAAFLSEHTARLVGGHFILRDLGPFDVKGVPEPVRAFALEGTRRRPGTAASSTLVGRAEELGALEVALAQAQEGQGQVVGVVGEAGVGKSRLCQEFVQAAAARGITVRRAAGVSHARDVPLVPVLQFMRDYFGIADSDSRPEAQDKIAARTLALDPSLDDALPLLFDFLEVPDERRPAPRLSPEARMQRLFAVLRRVTQRRSDRETLVLLLEDLHWFDPQSEAFVERLIPSFPGTRTLVLTNFRPEFTPPWAAHSYYRQLALQPLDPDSVRRLLDGLLGRDPSLSPLSDLIIERTAGYPFFVEEVVRSLVEDGTLTGEPGAYRLSRPVTALPVPATVQATLSARIDRLAEMDKSVLQTAAVIGRDFAEPVVRMVAGVPEAELGGALGRLCGAEFLQEVSSGPVDEYRFWHPLTQEVAYGSLLRERRAALHEAVAQAIIAIESDRLDERAALLAVHFERAGNRLETARWNERAAGFALRRDVTEAMRRWRETLAQLALAPESDDALRIGVRAGNRLIRYGARTGVDLDEARTLYAEAKARAERLQDPLQLASITHAWGAPLFWRGAVRKSFDLYVEAARLADASDDVDAQAGYAYTAAFVCSCWVGPVPEGIRLLQRVRDLCGDDPSVGVSVLGFSPLSGVGRMAAELLLLDGRRDEAHAALNDGLAMSRARAESEWIAWNLSVYARLARTPDELEVSLKHAHEGVRVAIDSANTSNHVVTRGAVGIAELGLGRFDEAADSLRSAVAEARRHQVGLFDEARLLAHLARAELAGGDHQAALRTATDAVDIARRQGATLIEGPALLTRARIRRATGAPSADVDADLTSALSLARETEATDWESEILAARSGA